LLTAVSLISCVIFAVAVISARVIRKDKDFFSNFGMNVFVWLVSPYDEIDKEKKAMVAVWCARVSLIVPLIASVIVGRT
jgi:hypothetical protein